MCDQWISMATAAVVSTSEASLLAKSAAHARVLHGPRGIPTLITHQRNTSSATGTFEGGDSALCVILQFQSKDWNGLRPNVLAGSSKSSRTEAVKRLLCKIRIAARNTPRLGPGVVHASDICSLAKARAKRRAWLTVRNAHSDIVTFDANNEWVPSRARRHEVEGETHRRAHFRDVAPVVGRRL